MNLKELRAKLAGARGRGKAKVDEYEALRGKAELTAEDQQRLTALDGEITAIEDEVSKLSATVDDEEKRARRAGLFIPQQGGGRQQSSTNEPNPETTGGFRSMSEFGVSVRNATVNPSALDPRLAGPTNFHQNGGSAGEGFLVPAQFREQIWSLVFEERDLLSLVSPEPTSSNAVQIIKDETTPWGASGVQAYWRAEAGQMTPSKASLLGSTVHLHELYAFVTASDELLADAPRLNNLLTVQAARAIRWKASDSIMWGTGAGMPLGFMAASAKVAQAKESGQAAKTIKVENVLNAYSRLFGAAPRAFWLANRDILPQVATLTLGNQPVYMSPNQGMREAPTGMLMGLPLLFSEHAKTLGAEGDLTLIDPDGYYAVTKQGGGIDFASSIHLFFDYGLQAFRWTFRLGGQPFLSAPVTPAKSTITKSPFVSLAERA